MLERFVQGTVLRHAICVIEKARDGRDFQTNGQVSGGEILYISRVRRSPNGEKYHSSHEEILLLTIVSSNHEQKCHEDGAQETVHKERLWRHSHFGVMFPGHNSFLVFISITVSSHDEKILTSRRLCTSS